MNAHVNQAASADAPPEIEELQATRQRAIRWALLAITALIVVPPLVLSGVLLLNRTELAGTNFYAVSVLLLKTCVSLYSLAAAPLGLIAFVLLIRIAFDDSLLIGAVGVVIALILSLVLLTWAPHLTTSSISLVWQLPLCANFFLVIYAAIFAREEGRWPVYFAGGSYALGLVAVGLMFVVAHLSPPSL